MRQQPTIAALAVAIALAGCSAATEYQASVDSNAATAASDAKPATPTPVDPAPAISIEADNAAAPAAASARVLGLEGLGGLRIGQPVPAGSTWAERGAQTGDACRTVTSPDYPGVYAIVSEGAVRRITVGQRSDVKLAEGVGAGATEADVLKWFAGFREEPHKYEAAPAKYLTAPNAARGGPALRFEIGQDGKISLIHVGTMPVLGYVEGCS